MTSIAWFEIPVRDLDRAVRFYEAILGIRLQIHDLGALRMGWFPGEDSKPSGALVQAEAYEPSHAGSMLYFATEDIDGVLQRVQENGGKVINARTSIGEHGFVGHFEDSEGNRLGLRSK